MCLKSENPTVCRCRTYRAAVTAIVRLAKGHSLTDEDYGKLFVKLLHGLSEDDARRLIQEGE